MAKLIEISTPDGDILVAARTPEDAIHPVGVRDDLIEKVDTSLDNTLLVVRRIAASFTRALAATEVDGAEVELGLQFTAKGKLFVVEAEGQSALKVRLKLRLTQPANGHGR